MKNNTKELNETTSIIEDYLEYLNEASAWKKRLAQGAIKNVEKLKQFAKPHKEYVAGVEKGTDEILRKHNDPILKKVYKEKLQSLSKEERKKLLDELRGNSEVIHAKSPAPASLVQSYSKVMMMPEKDKTKFFRLMMRLKHGVKMSSKEFEAERPYIKRHEADEIKAGTKQLSRSVNNPGAYQFMKGKKLVGQHYGHEVLQKEKKLTDFAHAIYGDAAKLRELRGKTGEYEYIDGLLKKYAKKFETAAERSRSEVLDEKMKQLAKVEAMQAKTFIEKLRKMKDFVKGFTGVRKAMVTPVQMKK